MENIKFEITEQDIINYLQKHKSDPSVKYKEAMFVKYLKENGMFTREMFEILLEKSNNKKYLIGEYSYFDNGIFNETAMPTFDYYLEGIKKLDLSGICHIMIPTLTYYNIANKRLHVLNELGCLVEKMKFETSESITNVRNDTVENYTIAYGKKIENWCSWTDFNFSKEASRKMLQEYVSIYGEEPVKIIKKIIKERV